MSNQSDRSDSIQNISRCWWFGGCGGFGVGGFSVGGFGVGGFGVGGFLVVGLVVRTFGICGAGDRC